jgi:hypothetical protein
MIVLIVILCVTCVALLAWGFTGFNRSLRFASLLGASMAGFAVPQVIGLSNNPVLPDGALEMFVLMAVLCMVCAVIGDLWGFAHPGSPPRRIGEYDERRVNEAALIFTVVAIAVSTMIMAMFAEEIARRAMAPGGGSGPMVIAFFFGAVHRYGFALALLLFWRRPSTLPLLSIIVGLANYVQLVLFSARRGPAIEFVFIVLLTFAMARRKNIPAIVITILFVAGTMWSTTIDHFRAANDMDLVEKVETADFLKTFQDVLDHGGLEVQNGAEVIWSTYQNETYEYGKLHWNRIVHGYFPGQIFGYQMKQDLQFDLVDVAEQANVRRGTVGATATGMADCFTSFGYFGCLKYLVIGAAMGRWYRRAFQGDLAAQLAYCSLISAALHTVSHGTTWFVNEYIHMAIFSYPLLYWARKPVRQAMGNLRRPALGPAAVAHTGLR